MRLFVTLSLALLPLPAFAYLDPGTGSIILQALVAGFMSIMIFFANARMYVRDFFTRLFKNKKNET